MNEEENDKLSRDSINQTIVNAEENKHFSKSNSPIIKEQIEGN